MVSDGTLFYNAVLVTPGGLVEGGLLVKSGRIASIHASPGELPEVTTAIDLEGHFLAPGFIDLHLHGGLGVDLMTATADDLTSLSRFLLANGVTRFLPTTVPSDEAAYLHAIHITSQLIRSPESTSGGATVIGIHFEGPFVSPCRAGALNPGSLRQYRASGDIEVFLAGPVRQSGGVVMMTLAPELDGGLDLVKALKESGVVVSIGHSQATFEICDLAFEIGARHITHFPNALSPLHHRQPGVLGWGLIRDRVTLDVIADGVHVDRRMVQLVHRNKSSERMGLISDAIAPCGLGDGDYEVWGERIQVRDGKTSNAAGNLAGSVITMRQAVSNLAQWGFPLEDISLMASAVPARVLGIYDEVGSLARGKRADLIAFGKDFQVTLAAVDGRVTKFPQAASRPAGPPAISPAP